ncbi:MAG: hypothetical protein KAJ19_14260 [Gammaproteobacteria bacterium]|nr:hypothetical protein [Gammaproteobacteria bacterium]
MKKLLILLIIFSISSSGCLNEPEPYANIQFKISIWTDENATLYLPLPLDLPNYTVSDLVSLIKVSDKPEDTEVSYYVIDTVHGKALRVNTTGNVILSAKAGYEYLESHPEMPIRPFTPGQEEPMFFDLSLQVNQTDKLNYERWIYLAAPDNSGINLKVFQYLYAGVSAGAEGWKTLENNSPYYGNFTLKPGWQIIRFDHGIGYA